MNLRFWDRPKFVDIEALTSGKVQLRGKDGKPIQVQERSYAAAQQSRLNMDWRPTGSSADTEVRQDLAYLRNRSRQLIRDNPYAKGGLRSLTNNVIGRGIAPLVQLRTADGKFDKEGSRKVEDLWWIWNRAKYSHAGRTLTFSAAQRVLYHSKRESGEVFLHRIDGFDRGSSVAMMVEIIEADHCPHDYEGTNHQTKNDIRQGIEFNKFNEPVAYYVYDRHPGDYRQPRGELRRISANEIIHLFNPLRPGQCRGVPEGHASMVMLHNVGAYEHAEILAARMGAAKAIWLKNTNNAVTLGKDAEGNQYLDWEAGGVGVLPNGYDIASVDMQHPNSNMPAFIQHMLRAAATGEGLSYETYTNDRAQSNYAGGRAASMAERILFQVEQDHFIEHCLARVYEWFLVAAHSSGELNIPGWFEKGHARDLIIAAVRWQGPAWPLVDPGKEVSAQVAMLDAKLTTRTAAIAELKGEDFRDTILKLEEEEIAMREHGLDPSTLAALASGVSVPDSVEELDEDGNVIEPAVTKAGAPAAPAAKGGTPAEAAANAVTSPTAALNGAQVTSAVDIVKSVANGELPRDAGLAILRIAFAVSDVDAAAMMGNAGTGFVPKVQPADKPRLEAVK